MTLMDETPFIEVPREVYCPLASIVVRPNRRTHVVQIFESVARVTRILVTDDVGKFFMIDGIVIEKIEQLTSPNISAAVFNPAAVGVALGMDTMREGSTFDLIVRNVDASAQKFYGALIATAMGGTLHRDAPTDENYHAFIERRQALYESIFEKVNPEERSDEDVFFNGQEIFAGSFSPKTNLWWVDVDGYKKRPVYAIEGVAIGDEKGGLRVVDVETYEGFE